MNKFTKKEQLGLLKRGLTRRLIGANPAIEEKERVITKIIEVRKEFIDRIEKYKDDEVVVNMLTAQVSEYDRQYAGTKQNYIDSIEEIKESEPTVKKALKYIEKVEKGNKDGSILYLLLDLFFRPVLTDWNELEESMKEEDNLFPSENDNG